MIHIKPERQNDEMRSRFVLNLRHHRKLHTRALGSPPTLRDTAIASSVGWNKQKSYPLSNFLILRGIIDYIEARNTLAKQTVYLIQALSRSSEQKQRAELEKCECHLRRRRRRRWLRFKCAAIQFSHQRRPPPQNSSRRWSAEQTVLSCCRLGTSGFNIGPLSSCFNRSLSKLVRPDSAHGAARSPGRR